MLGLRPHGGAAIGAVSLPQPVESPFRNLVRARNSKFAVVLELTGFPLGAYDVGSGAHPIGGGPIGANIGTLDDFDTPGLSEKKVFLSDAPYRTGPSDEVLPNMWTEARMTRRADVEQTAAIAQGASRRSQTTTGDVEFADQDRYLRNLAEEYSFTNRAAKVHVVGLTSPWNQRTTISNAVVGGLTQARGSVRVELEDSASLLNRPLVTRVYGGTGLRDGSQDLAGTSPPAGWGLCKFVRPVLEDPSIYLYRLSDHPINAVQRVEERGLALTNAGDVSSYDQLRLAADSLTGGEYKTCLNDGSIVIKFAGGSPAGEVRATFEGSRALGTYVAFAGDVMLDMLIASMRLDSSLVNATAFQGLPDYPISYYFPGGTSPTGEQVFNEICDSLFATYGSVIDDRIGIRLFYAPKGRPSEKPELTQDEIYSVEEVRPPQAPLKEQSVDYDPIQAPYTEDQLVGGLTAQEIAERTQPYGGRVTLSNAATAAQNRSAVSGAPIGSVFSGEAGARDAATRYMNVWSSEARAFEIECTMAAADIDRGGIQKITHPDLGARSGQTFLIYNSRLQLSKRRVLLTVVG